MKALFYSICVVLSLPNLLLGLAIAVLQHTFVSRNPFKILLQFLEAVVWGIPAAALVVLALLVAGFFSASQRYGAFLSILLNATALTLVFVRIGSPRDLWEAALFVPVLIALTGFGWIAFFGFETLERTVPPESPPA